MSVPPTPSTASVLHWSTPTAWVEQALADPLALLNDHAHLERKAASNALELLGRWPWPVDVRGEGPTQDGADRWSRVLASIARDEVAHLGQVLRLLTARGGHLERSHSNPYAAALRDLVRRGHGMAELVDRLLVSALIEARSGERFRLLSEHAGDEGLRRFYGSLVASEEGHYRAFLELAALLPARRGPSLETRWQELLAAEAALIAGLPVGSSMHSGMAR